MHKSIVLNNLNHKSHYSIMIRYDIIYLLLFIIDSNLINIYSCIIIPRPFFYITTLCVPICKYTREGERFGKYFGKYFVLNIIITVVSSDTLDMILLLLGVRVQNLINMYLFIFSLLKSFLKKKKERERVRIRLIGIR